MPDQFPIVRAYHPHIRQPTIVQVVLSKQSVAPRSVLAAEQWGEVGPLLLNRSRNGNVEHAQDGGERVDIRDGLRG